MSRRPGRGAAGDVGRRFRGGRAALLVAATAATLVCAEAGLRVFAPQTVPMEGLFREDPAVGLRHVPQFQGRIRTAEHDVAVSINSDGYRDREYPPRGPAFRVLGLGDSFAFGFGVEEPECYLSRLEQMTAERGVEVINAGHSGMGPDNEALLLEADGPWLRPDLVLVGIYVGNDMWNVLSGPHRATVVEGRLRSTPGILERWHRPVRAGRILPAMLPAVPASEALPVPFRTLLHRSHLYRLLSSRYAALRARRERGGAGGAAQPLSAVDDQAVFLRDQPPEFRAGWTQVCSWLARMASWCNAHGARLALLLIPTADQVYPERWATSRARFGLRDDEIDLGQPQRILLDCGRQHGLAAIDLLPALRKAAAGPGPPLYYRSDPHWTPRGHEVAAAEALARLRAEGLLP